MKRNKELEKKQFYVLVAMSLFGAVVMAMATKFYNIKSDILFFVWLGVSIVPLVTHLQKMKMPDIDE
ncbi:MAG: hypothetical protein RL757_2837 [Bacteroidota bacterium]|jgi:predicted membrane channel-forming protein YqfA (hemolysin III family)